MSDATEKLRVAAEAAITVADEMDNQLDAYEELRTIAAQLAEALKRRQWVGVGACDCGGIRDGVPHRKGCDAGDALAAWKGWNRES